MKNLIVVDLDNTLIPFDSFRKYTYSWIRYYPIQILLISLQRKLRLRTRSQFKSNVLSLVCGHPKFTEVNKKNAKRIIANLDEKVLDRVKYYNNNKSELLLLSASPNMYVRLVGEFLGWDAKGSYFSESGELIHLYGDEKVRFLTDVYPEKDYSYYYATSDSKSDDYLLSLFQFSDKV